MELKTESGVSITIIDDGSSKILLFDKSVRAVQLNDEEISRIRAELSTGAEVISGSTPKKKKPMKGEKAADDASEVC